MLVGPKLIRSSTRPVPSEWRIRRSTPGALVRGSCQTACLHQQPVRSAGRGCGMGITLGAYIGMVLAVVLVGMYIKPLLCDNSYIVYA
jgi:hypothetical protein